MMITNRASKSLLNYIGVFLFVALIASLFMGNSALFTAIGLLLVAEAMLYLKQMENITERTVAQRIKTEYSLETQPQVVQIYEHLKIKEIEGLFLKILDDSHGDVNKVKEFAAIAESVGWKAFIENRW